MADLTGDLPQEPMDEEEEEGEEEEDEDDSEESQEEGKERGREMSRNGGRQSTLEKNDNVDTVVRALRQDGKKQKNILGLSVQCKYTHMAIRFVWVV